ncbi:hypothetical protein L218DRAFT_946936 [Marasmius fiardii PR-910]|nr:hypothetical protein L218DRAFT_946936 [Marasmius fiardii PR-910]
MFSNSRNSNPDARSTHNGYSPPSNVGPGQKNDPQSQPAVLYRADSGAQHNYSGNGHFISFAPARNVNTGTGNFFVTDPGDGKSEPKNANPQPNTSPGQVYGSDSQYRQQQVNSNDSRAPQRIP